MCELVVHGVGEGGRLVVVYRHARVVREVGLVQHREHVVAADGQEGGADPAHVLQLDAREPGEDLPLARHLLGPLLLGELLAEAVGDGVGGDLVPVGVEGLHQRVVRPLMAATSRQSISRMWRHVCEHHNE